MSWETYWSWWPSARTGNSGQSPSSYNFTFSLLYFVTHLLTSQKSFTFFYLYTFFFFFFALPKSLHMNRIKLGLIRSRIELDQILRVKTVLTLDLATHDIISCPLSSPVFFPVRPPHLWYYSTIFCCCFNLNDFNKISGCIG